MDGPTNRTAPRYEQRHDRRRHHATYRVAATVTWTPEQQAHRREWDLDSLDADPRNLATVDPMDAVLRRRAAANGHASDASGSIELEPPLDVDLTPRFHGLIVPIDEYRAGVPTVIPWRCQPIVYSGGVTLIAGAPKAGKSTLAAQLQRCCETGEDFLGSWPVQIGPVLLVTEEGGVAVVHKTTDMHRLAVLDRRAAIRSGLGFRQVLDAIADWSAVNPDGIAFIDTLAIWAEIQNENDASEASKAVALVTSLAQQTDLAVVLVHHARKGGGEHGEGIRGSGAILATVDIAVELSRFDEAGDGRWLDVQGRVILPERFLLGFDRNSMTYRTEDKSGARLAEIEHDLAGIPTDGDGMTRPDIGGLWGRDPRKRIEELLDLGRLRSRYVKGERAFAYRYWSVPAQWTAPMEPDDA